MTWTLGIDTSHHVAVGLARDGEPVASDVVIDTRAHGETLIPLVQRVCASVGITMTEIDAYAVGMGPGPFTGLRVGIVTARTLAAVAGRPLHGVCSLDVIAAQWQDAPDEFVVASDARRKEFYWALYRDGIRVGEPRVSAPEVIPDLPAAGPVPDDPAGPRFLDAAVLAARWADLPVVDGEPFYLRAADAAVPRTRKSALPRLRVPR
ncbi:MAG: tRNA (adenosine(37)-N6)-threonylcarbamoyltransferase complex dimerization subunit type 1 TsaB [Propionibacteriaceae bacterium]|jgi:universal bacterial protein yeaZ|nr:tRNA (adenosine(37)-N6)-threonylcarbamoyltransferase complex dimerization subunit type 1 TsaB [Propionibacterium sp.]MDO4645240.1 tRNA (adenosine(37)-N6)-threonylcarbamoyltransferase complex dimerization subunit type 1 TsaB [Propionibacteriaceae bacterium]